ncbi:hypothetical protein FRC11_005146 [Ceratobasidium sp. 423]|nr:hypothetical protein FRC11_005146 [Ceratobasidium sp. 423]
MEEMLGTPSISDPTEEFFTGPNHNIPDYLPVHLNNPMPAYCHPHPHWKLHLSEQVTCIMMFVLHFWVTVPRNGSALSTDLLRLSDDEIINLLYDGPFRTLQNAYHREKKDVAKVEVKAEKAVVSVEPVHRERKAFAWQSQCLEVKVLTDSSWDALYHKGVMLCVNSDDKSEQPSWRRQWDLNSKEVDQVTVTGGDGGAYTGGDQGDEYGLSKPVADLALHLNSGKMATKESDRDLDESAPILILDVGMPAPALVDLGETYASGGVGVAWLHVELPQTDTLQVDPVILLDPSHHQQDVQDGIVVK